MKISWLIRIRSVRRLPRMLGLVLALALLAAPTGRAANCADSACVQVSGKLASIDSQRSALLNTFLGGLLGSSVSLDVVAWQGLANANVNLLQVLQLLQAQASLGTPEQALNTTVTTGMFFSATASALQANGNTAAANAITSLAVANPVGSIRLSELLDICTTCSSYADINLNALDLLMGSVELVNFNNLLYTPTPITVSGASLGLGATVTSVKLYAQICEPPRIACGKTGSTFYGAAVRVKLDLDLVDVNLTTAVNNRLSLTGVVLALLGVNTLQTQLLNVSVYADIARVTGTLGVMDALAQTISVQAKPGAVNLYLGQIADNVFFTRRRAINPATDLQFGTVGSLNVNLGLLGVAANVRIKSYVGQAPAGNSTVSFTGPYPQVQKVAIAGSTFVNDLVDTLMSNLQVDVQLITSLGAGDLNLFLALTSDIGPALKFVYQGALGPLLKPILKNALDPMLELLGIRIGEADIKVLGVRRRCNVSVSGAVYRDANRSRTRDGAEAGTGLTLYAKFVDAATPTGPALAVVPIDATSGLYAFTTVTSGTYRIVIDDNQTLADVTALSLPSGWTGTEQSTLVRTSVVVTTNDLAGQDFGLVPSGLVGADLTTDGQQTAQPGATLLYPHSFIATAAGQLELTITDVANPAISGWLHLIYVDANGNGLVDPAETTVSGAVAVTAGQTLVLLVKSTIPAHAAYGSTDTATLKAAYTWGTGASAITQNYTRVDVTTVGASGTAGLVLQKSVDKTSAKPGETLVYTITFTNRAAIAVKNVVVMDMTPTFTRFASAATSNTPTSLGTAAITAPAIGGAGGIKWTFPGDLAPGGTGTVTFSVTVEQ